MSSDKLVISNSKFLNNTKSILSSLRELLKWSHNDSSSNIGTIFSSSNLLNMLIAQTNPRSYFDTISDSLVYRLSDKVSMLSILTRVPIKLIICSSKIFQVLFNLETSPWNDCNNVLYAIEDTDLSVSNIPINHIGIELFKYLLYFLPPTIFKKLP